MTYERAKIMSNNLFASVFAVALSLASAASFATPTGVDVRDQVLPVKAQAEEGRTRYWSHPRLGMVKVDAAGRMLTGDSAKDDTARSAASSGNPSTRAR
ncbi:hypothetical protein ACINB_43640 [Acidovorax sp. NB1]|nr:hypothetical protein ACINB_43640 [Acidovorax sp. NB1]